MIVKDLFHCMNTDVPRILIYNFSEEVVYQKHSNKPIGKLPFWENEVAWIYRADSTEIAIRISHEDHANV